MLDVTYHLMALYFDVRFIVRSLFELTLPLKAFGEVGFIAWHCLVLRNLACGDGDRDEQVLTADVTYHRVMLWAYFVLFVNSFMIAFYEVQV